MRRSILAAAAFALLAPAAAPATSVTAAPPHDPKRGCKAIKQVVADLNAGRLSDPESSGAGPTFFSDAYGEVEESEAAAFLHSMHHSEGKKDEKPIELRDVYIVHRDKDYPIYLVVLARESWHEKRLVDDGMLGMDEVDDPHFETDSSSWLASFMSDDLTDFREAPELFRLRGDSAELKDCY